MAYPVLRSHSAGTVTSNATLWPVTYPDTIDDGGASEIVSGDLLLCLIGTDGSGRFFTNFASGWNELVSGLSDGSCSFDAWYKIADGTETPGGGVWNTSTGIICSGSEQGPWRVSCYKNFYGAGGVIVSTGATGSTSPADPDSLALTWGAGVNTRALAAGASDGTVTVTGYPTGYDLNPYADHSGGGAGAGLFQAGANVVTTPQNPDGFSLSGDDGWAAATFGIRGTTGGEDYYGATTQAFSLVETTSGLLTSKAAVVFALSAGLTTSGTASSPAQNRYGQTSLEQTVLLLTSGEVTSFGQTTATFVAGLTTAGTRTLVGQASSVFLFDAVTQGTVQGGAGEDVFGTVAAAYTASLTSAGHIAQLALATADSVDGAWTDQDGGTNLEAAIDELVAVDADYIRSELQPDNSVCRVKLSALGDPNSSTGHVLRWRIAKDAADGATVNMTLALYEGGGDVLGAGTLIASFPRLDVSETFTTYEEHLSDAEADAISDYSDLYVELTGDVV